MPLPYEIIFHNMDKSEAVESRVREKVAHLEDLYERVTRCRVTIEAPHKNHRKGNSYQVRILLDVPQGPLVVSHDPGDVHAHKDVYLAIRDAFQVAERQLKEPLPDGPSKGLIADPSPVEYYYKVREYDEKTGNPTPALVERLELLD